MSRFADYQRAREHERIRQLKAPADCAWCHGPLTPGHAYTHGPDGPRHDHGLKPNQTNGHCRG